MTPEQIAHDLYVAVDTECKVPFEETHEDALREALHTLNEGNQFEGGEICADDAVLCWQLCMYILKHGALPSKYRL